MSVDGSWKAIVCKYYSIWMCVCVCVCVCRGGQPQVLIIIYDHIRLESGVGSGFFAVVREHYSCPRPLASHHLAWWGCLPVIFWHSPPGRSQIRRICLQWSALDQCQGWDAARARWSQRVGQLLRLNAFGDKSGGAFRLMELFLWNQSSAVVFSPEACILMSDWLICGPLPVKCSAMFPGWLLAVSAVWHQTGRVWVY